MNWCEVFLYDSLTGDLRWRSDRGARAKAGALAGSVSDQGYLRVHINKKSYTAHRIIWDILHPDNKIKSNEEIDHIDHNRLNNRACNLRKVNKQGNQQNASRRKDNTSGITGVYWYPSTSRWTAHIFANGRRINLGYFLSLLDAVAARKSAEIQYGFHENHGRGKTQCQ